MKEATNQRTIDEILTELAQAIEAERQALISLDEVGMDAALTMKVSLAAELEPLQAQLTSEHRARLAVVHGALRNNLVLLVHARDHVQGVIELFTGASPVRRPSYQPHHDGGRLNLRG